MSSSPRSCVRQRSARRRLPFAPALLTLAIQAAFISSVMAQTGAPELQKVDVTAEATNASEVTKSYENPVVSSSTGLTLTRRETPQSVSTVTRQQMDDENVTTLDDALLHATGITAEQLDVGVRTTYRARGYAITNFKVDGATMDGGTDFTGQGAAVNMDMYDRVEILRGANGLLGSTGDPSGVIELVRKEARRTPSASISATLGSWDRKRITADLNRPLTSDGSIRARFVVSAEDSDGFRDREKNKSLGVLANFGADLTANTRLGLGVQYERRKMNGATWGTNVPIWFADGTPTDFKRSLSSSPDWSMSERETRTVFASLEHDFANRWKTKLIVSQAEGEAINHLAVAKANNPTVPNPDRGYWNANGTGAYLNTMFQESENTTKNINWTANGPYQLFGRTHELLVGLNGSDTTTTTLGIECSINGGAYGACMNRINPQLAIGDWRDFIKTGDGINKPVVRHTGNDTERRIKTYGGYLASRFSVTDDLSVIAGARLSWQKSYTNGNLVSEFNKEITPYLGAVYDLNRNYSLYASYTDIFKVQTQRQVNGDYVDPETGKSYEVGVKGEWLDGLFDGSVAVFRTEKEGTAYALEDANGNPIYIVNEPTVRAYGNGGTGIVTKGFEFDFSGRLTPNWNVYGGYTYMDAENPNSTSRAQSDPRHLLRLNTSYRLPGEWNKLTIGGGLTAQSRMRGNATGTSHPTLPASQVNVDTKGYTLFHAMARYDINKDLVATLNISNLFDKKYYRQYGFYAGAIYGQPRTVSLNLRATF